jgi:hypothetical protein
MPGNVARKSKHCWFGERYQTLIPVIVTVLASVFEKYPNRFKHKIAVPDTLPEAVWINPPSKETIGV